MKNGKWTVISMKKKKKKKLKTTTQRQEWLLGDVGKSLYGNRVFENKKDKINSLEKVLT